MSFSLYVHIPYCQAKCPYCDFNSYAAATWPEADYTRALILEMERRLVFPATITAGFAGTAQVFQQALRGQGLLILATVVVIYLVLGILYESFVHPITNETMHWEMPLPPELREVLVRLRQPR